MIPIQVDGKSKEAGGRPFDQRVFLHGPFLLCAHTSQSTESICRIIEALNSHQQGRRVVGISDCALALANFGGSNAS